MPTQQNLTGYPSIDKPWLKYCICCLINQILRKDDMIILSLKIGTILISLPQVLYICTAQKIVPCPIFLIAQH